MSSSSVKSMVMGVLWRIFIMSRAIQLDRLYIIHTSLPQLTIAFSISPRNVSHVPLPWMFFDNMVLSDSMSNFLTLFVPVNDGCRIAQCNHFRRTAAMFSSLLPPGFCHLRHWLFNRPPDVKVALICCPYSYLTPIRRRSGEIHPLLRLVCDACDLLAAFLHSDGIYTVLMHRVTRAVNQPVQ